MQRSWKWSIHPPTNSFMVTHTYLEWESPFCVVHRGWVAMASSLWLWVWSRPRKFVFHLLRAATQRRAVLEEFRCKGSGATKNSGLHWWDLRLNYELRRDEETATVIDVAERFGEMERDRWEEGRESEMGRNIPLNFWRHVFGDIIWIGLYISTVLPCHIAYNPPFV